MKGLGIIRKAPVETKKRLRQHGTVETILKNKSFVSLGASLFFTALLAFFTNAPDLTNQFNNLPQLGSSRHLSHQFRKFPIERSLRVSVSPIITLARRGSNKVQFPRGILHQTRYKKKFNKEKTIPDYGGLQLEFLDHDDEMRRIWNEDRIPIYQPPPFVRDQSHSFYVTDDDYELQMEYLNFNTPRDSEGFVEPTDCQYTKAVNQVFPNCNTFHELGFEELIRSGKAGLVGSGDYKKVLSIVTDLDRFILKEAPLDSDGEFSFADIGELEMDGIVSANVVPHPRMVNFYGSCVLSQLNEAMKYGDAEQIVVYDRCEGNITMSLSHPLVSANDMSPVQKIIYALDMAESIAQLHNNPLGVIVHGDIQLTQWLIDENGRPRLNDFNRATIMMYSKEKEKYCKFRNGVGPGDWRAPEEYRNDPLDEQVDVFSLGNNFYVLLTGVYPFPELCEYSDVAEMIVQGKRAFIDPRWKDQSYEEGKLAELISMCWEENPADRPNIGQVVTFLADIIDNFFFRTKKKNAIR